MLTWARYDALHGPAPRPCFAPALPPGILACPGAIVFCVFPDLVSLFVCRVSYFIRVLSLLSGFSCFHADLPNFCLSPFFFGPLPVLSILFWSVAVLRIVLIYSISFCFFAQPCPFHNSDFGGALWWKLKKRRESSVHSRLMTVGDSGSPWGCATVFRLYFYQDLCLG